MVLQMWCERAQLNVLGYEDFKQQPYLKLMVECHGH